MVKRVTLSVYVNVEDVDVATEELEEAFSGATTPMWVPRGPLVTIDDGDPEAAALAMAHFGEDFD